MKKKALRVPAVIAYAVLGGAAVVAPLAASCGGGSPPVDGAVSGDGNACELFCVPDGTDAGTVCDSCADAGSCPSGCVPVG